MQRVTPWQLSIAYAFAEMAVCCLPNVSSPFCLSHGHMSTSDMIRQRQQPEVNIVELAGLLASTPLSM